MDRHNGDKEMSGDNLMLRTFGNEFIALTSLSEAYSSCKSYVTCLPVPLLHLIIKAGISVCPRTRGVECEVVWMSG